MFPWDQVKNRSNQKKHGVSFEAATLVFDDPFHLSRLERVTDGEERWRAIGRAGGMLLLLVVHTWKNSLRRTRTYESSPLDALTNRKGNYMRKVSKSIRKELMALANRPDIEIDYSDIPATTREGWAGAVRGKFYRPIKQQLTVRIDADVLAWLKSYGKGYQSRLNAILRSVMLGKTGRRRTD